MDTLSLLETGDITLEGQFLWGSNYTLLVDVQCDEDITKAVYKPTQGVRPLWDFEAPSLARRELVAYLISEKLGWELVPPTIYRKSGPMGPGSLQLFIEHDVDYHFFNFSEDDRLRLKPSAAFDVLINNADRKGGHFIVDPEKHIWLIDHGICFHEEPKLRTVLWDFAKEAIPENLLQDMDHLFTEIRLKGDFYEQLHLHLSGREISAMAQRMEELLQTKTYPTPPEHTRPYPWPLV